MSIGKIYGTDSLDVLVTITDQETGMALDLTGATLAVAAKVNVSVISGTATVVDSFEGKVLVSFAAGAFLGKSGAYTAHLRVTKGAEVQTVAVLLFTVEAAIVEQPAA